MMWGWLDGYGRVDSALVVVGGEGLVRSDYHATQLVRIAKGLIESAGWGFMIAAVGLCSGGRPDPAMDVGDGGGVC